MTMLDNMARRLVSSQNNALTSQYIPQMADKMPTTRQIDLPEITTLLSFLIPICRFIYIAPVRDTFSPP